MNTGPDDNSGNEPKTRKRGQIIKRGKNKYVVRITMTNGATGKRKTCNKTIYGPKKDAEKYKTAVLREIDLGVFVEPSRMTVNQYLDKWLEAAAKPRLRERTYNDYVDMMRRYVRNALGATRLDSLKPLDIQTLYGEMQARLSPRIIRYTHSILSSALKQAVMWGMLSRNPAEFVELPKMAKREMDALTAEEVGKLLKASEGDRHAIIFAFAVATGMRPEEYLGLQWRDVDLQKGTATIQRALIWRKGGGWYYDDPKTPQSRRTIPLPASIVKQLSAHKVKQAEHRLKLGKEYENNNLVFATEFGTPIRVGNLSCRHFKPALKTAGLPATVRLYDLRHTCATLLLLAGENPKVVSERLGHASITLTLDTYSHVLPNMQKAAAEKLENLLFSNVRTL
ncbi:MAG TPA: tyrosine-type recombinase/integrase [Blastocatellia bacterium]|nr:tyrosine-type recombinase/integrase [Blastocatellia bacterium]